MIENYYYCKLRPVKKKEKLIRAEIISGMATPKRIATPERIAECKTMLDKIKLDFVTRYGDWIPTDNADQNGFSVTWYVETTGCVTLNIRINHERGVIEYLIDKKAVDSIPHESDGDKMIVIVSSVKIIVFKHPAVHYYTLAFNPTRLYNNHDALTMATTVLDGILAA